MCSYLFFMDLWPNFRSKIWTIFFIFSKFFYASNLKLYVRSTIKTDFKNIFFLLLKANCFFGQAVLL